MSGQVAVFRCDASRQLGSGHVVRCLALADALAEAGWTCIFATTPGTRNAVPLLANSSHRLLELTGANDELVQLVQELPEGCHLLIVDHYQRDVQFEAGARPWADRILAIDDLADRQHECDLLLDPTVGRRRKDYETLVPSHCALLLGPAYALLRPQFLAARSAALTRRAERHSVGRILVSLGGGDTLQIVTKVLRGIQLSRVEPEIDVVLGSVTPASDEFAVLIQRNGAKITVHGAVDDMASLMLRADLAIGAAGTTAWERCALGLPSIVLQIADNQRLVGDTLARSGAALFLGRQEDVTEAQLAECVDELATNETALAAMAQRAAGVCDGRGVQRAMLALLQPEAARNGSAVTLRLAEAGDEGLVLSWQRDPATRRFARNPAVPSADEHRLWMNARMMDPDSIFAIIACGGTPAGMLRMDRSGNTSSSREISILVAPELHRQGIGGCALSLARQLLPGIELVAEVLPDNVSSLKLFSLAGYQRYDDQLFHSRPHRAL